MKAARFVAPGRPLSVDDVADPVPGPNDVVVTVTRGGQPRNHIGRLYADGSLDTTLNSGANGLVRSLAIQADQKILLGGLFNTVGGEAHTNVSRLNQNGSLDATFHAGADGNVNCLTVQLDGKDIPQAGAPESGGSASWSIDTTRFAFSTRIASTARRFGPPRRSAPVSRTTSSGPRMRNSSRGLTVAAS